MDQPLFACTKCYRNFPQSEMSRSGQTCKGCSPHHSAFKQCEYCKSDFKYYVFGEICPRCQSLKSKYGEPQSCSICMLKTAFGTALVCQRCLHYRNRFGEPRQCQSCGKMCAFLKDTASRDKVEGQILCWVCTYNFKLARSRERSSHGINKRRHDCNQPSDHNRTKTVDNVKRNRPDAYDSHKSDSHPPNPQQVHSLDSVYNEHLLTISQLQDEVKALKRQLMQKDTELLAKDRVIAELKSEMIEMKNVHDDRVLKLKSASQMEHDRLTSVIRQLQKEKTSLNQSLKRRKSNPGSMNLKHSMSSITLFTPDSSIQLTSLDKTRGNSVNKRSVQSKPQTVVRPEPEIDTFIPSDPSDRSRNTDHLSSSRLSMLQFDDEYDADSNQTPQHRENSKHTSSKSQHTSSPDLTPSLSSGPLTDDEMAAPNCASNRSNLIIDDPLDFGTLTDSDEGEEEEEEAVAAEEGGINDEERG